LQLCKMLDAQRAIQDAIDQLARSLVPAHADEVDRWPL
jgi:hypothetical protein